MINASNSGKPVPSPAPRPTVIFVEESEPEIGVLDVDTVADGVEVLNSVTVTVSVLICLERA